MDLELDERRARRRALLGAGVIAGGYFLGAGTYIVVSTVWVGGLDVGSNNQTQLELFKGLGFVLVTALLLMIAMGYLLVRLQRTELALAARAGALARAQQQALVGTIAAAVGHDMKNMVAVLNANLSVMSEEAEGGTKEMADDCLESVERLRTLTGELMDLGRGADRNLERVNMRQLVKDCVRLSRLFAKDNRCAILVDAPRDCWVEADRKELEHVIINLILNAAEATGGGGRVDVYVFEEDDHVVLRVHDDGPGVPAELRGKIFEPFFTTKGTGTGLGLAITRDIVRQYAGNIQLRDSDAGAEFEVTMAARSHPPGQQGSPPASQ